MAQLQLLLSITYVLPPCITLSIQLDYIITEGPVVFYLGKYRKMNIMAPQVE